MSHVTFKEKKKEKKSNEAVSEGSVINGAYRVLFLSIQLFNIVLLAVVPSWHLFQGIKVNRTLLHK